MNIPTLPLINLDRNKSIPLYWQIYGELRQSILSGQLAAGMRLPSSREMAAALHVSRNTVKDAYEQLIAEGYLDASIGSGTYVTRRLPDDLLSTCRSGSTPSSGEPTSRATPPNRTVSRFGNAMRPFGYGVMRQSQKETLSPFAIGTPALDAFPIDLWARIASSVNRRMQPWQLGPNQDPLGYRPLREAIANYLNAVRGVRCHADHILIVSGSQKGLYLIAKALLNSGDGVWLEEPGYGGSQGVVRILQSDISPVPVDREGIDVAQGKVLNTAARVAFVTPSHQFPLGYTMSLLRRLQLLQWAEEAGSWIVEDDYDSEFRYSGRPLAALQGLDTNARVIYVGTLSKVLFPALRLGYLILPPDLVDLFVGVKLPIDIYPPLANQMVAAEFISQGHFARHIRRMLALYAERRDALIGTIERELAGALMLGPSECGMHVAGWLANDLDEEAIARRAAAAGIPIGRLSRYYFGKEKRSGLLLGFTSAPVTEIVRGVQLLARVIGGG